jgi:hypothetical protein
LRKTIPHLVSKIAFYFITRKAFFLGTVFGIPQHLEIGQEISLMVFALITEKSNNCFLSKPLKRLERETPELQAGKKLCAQCQELWSFLGMRRVQSEVGGR